MIDMGFSILTSVRSGRQQRRQESTEDRERAPTAATQAVDHQQQGVEDPVGEQLLEVGDSVACRVLLEIEEPAWSGNTCIGRSFSGVGLCQVP